MPNSNNSGGKVITYVPQADEEVAVKEMNGLRRGVWFYTHQLGQNFTLLLFLSLCYQAFMASFIAFDALVHLPLLRGLMESDNAVFHILGYIAALGIALVLHGILIAEMAEVVWLRHPDKLKVRLMSGSVWWWVMLGLLLVTTAIDIFLIFLAVTGEFNFASAWLVLSQNQMTGASNLILVLVDVLTLFRCASVMRTSNSEEIRREVEERLRSQAEEILINAGDSVRNKAIRVWESLSVNPQQLIPLQSSVINLISQQHPDLIPNGLQGVDWAYDPSSHSLAALPPDVHQALLQGRNQMVSRAELLGGSVGNGNSIEAKMWGLSPNSMAEVLASKFQQNGQPKFIDMTEPEQGPRYMNRRRPTNIRFYDDVVDNEAGVAANAGLLPANSGSGTGNNFFMQQQQGPMQQLSQMPPIERALFAGYLMNSIFPMVYGQRYVEVAGTNIFQMFDPIDLAFYYRHWKKESGSNATQMQMPSQQQSVPFTQGPGGFFG